MACRAGASAMSGGWNGCAACAPSGASRSDSLGTVKMEAAEGAGGGTKVIDAKGVAFAYGEREIVRDFSMRIHRGDRIALVGPNGAGKTTLLKLLTGELTPEKGNVKLGQGLLMAQAGPEPQPACIPNSRWRRPSPMAAATR